ncbi:hypothetical protein AAFF_G00432240 [Aldrovandia affinis]|uniref:Uncharacterized protein n=1 Tax=Aldrovandia affinis TaxID=143900 RepID=A0AAD7R333_9TELE|nr:hypothetical protein AAFF_G00432240 [Aldrovandia affinis]
MFLKTQLCHRPRPACIRAVLASITALDGAHRTAADAVYATCVELDAPAPSPHKETADVDTLRLLFSAP